MAKLAIRGHETRGKEVIEILEMLGGKKTIELCGNATAALYSIFNDRHIDYFNESRYNKNETEIFTLEEFLEKFPHKVGDKVKNARINDFIGRIINARWDDNEKQIIYTVEWDDAIKSTLNYYARGLQPYKEETMKEKLEQITLDIPDGYEFFGINDDNKVVLIKKHIQYPKTYEECCKVMGISRYDVEIDLPQPYQQNIFALFKLLICRNAYWKIAGEEMGLGKPWKPIRNEECFTIFRSCGKVCLYKGAGQCELFEFPTKEMRDAFKENFDKDIEFCKEFL